jgi:alpha-1,3-rhamnosyl/mannosyltransferase
MRYPPVGSAGYAHTTMDKLAEHRPPDWEVVALTGWPRLDHGSNLPAALRRASNVALDIGWLGWGAPIEAARHDLDAWFTPASILPMTVPRPMVTVTHNLAFAIAPELFDPAYRRVAEALHRASVKRATRIIAPSEFLRRTVIERLGAHPDKVSVVPIGIDHLPAPAESSGLAIDRPYALFIGQTQPHWNVGVLIDAWRSGVPEELALVISGAAGADDANLRRRAAAAGLEKRVHFTGLLPPDRLRALIRDARLFVDPGLAESFGKPAIEAMMLGIPCAVSDRGALPETTQGAALLFDATDPEQIVDAVTRLHTDQELRDRLAIEGPRVAGRFRWATSAAAYWDVVRAAVDERASVR